MSVWRQLYPLVVLAPVFVLFVVGLVIAVRSGEAGLSRGQHLRVAAVNFTSVALRVAGYVTGLVIVERLIGAPVALGW